MARKMTLKRAMTDMTMGAITFLTFIIIVFLAYKGLQVCGLESLLDSRCPCN